MNFHQKSYELHAKTYASREKDLDEIELYRDWFNNGSVDIWRHLRMLEGLHPFLEEHKGARWLTVGDGRFGSSAIYIQKHNSQALPTDIDDSLLVVAKEQKMIDDFKNENAEKLSFTDDAFDYVFCKESFHHFPRPYLALYEMLRCAKSAIVFSEPKDFLPLPIPRRILQMIKHLLKKLTGKKIDHTDTGNYEPVGNYVYTISKREFQKIAIALNLPMVAFKEFHDSYYEGVEQEKEADNGPLFRKIKKDILINEIGCRLGISQRNRVTAVIFKEMPSEAIEAGFRKRGFEIIRLPKNPFI